MYHFNQYDIFDRDEAERELKEIKKAQKEARKEVREEAKARKDSYKFKITI